MWRASRPCGGAAATEYETERARATIIEGNIRSVSVGEGLRKVEGNKERALLSF